MGATGTRMHIDMVEYDDAWQRVGGNSFQLDKSFFNPHDFGMTPNHYVFFQARVQGAALRLPAGKGVRAGLWVCRGVSTAITSLSLLVHWPTCNGMCMWAKGVAETRLHGVAVLSVAHDENLGRE